MAEEDDFKKLWGGDADTHEDTDDQIHLRNVVLQELAAVLQKHNCGGVLFVGSFKSVAWQIVDPQWSGIYVTPVGAGHELRLRIHSKTPEAAKMGNATVTYIKAMRDFSAQAFLRFDRLWEMAKRGLGDRLDTEKKFMMNDKPKPPKGSA